MEAKLSPALLLIFLLVVPSITTARRLDQELSHAILALRSHGYKHFPDTVAGSDLLLHVPSGKSTLTLFSPPDSFLFSPSDSLFHFVSPFRLSALQVRILSSGTRLETLLPHRYLLIQRTKLLLNRTVSELVTVNGMRLSVPNLYMGSSIAVHGLDGFLGGGLKSKVFQIDKFVTPYISPLMETGLYWVNQTNREENRERRSNHRYRFFLN